MNETPSPFSDQSLSRMLGRAARNAVNWFTGKDENESPAPAADTIAIEPSRDPKAYIASLFAEDNTPSAPTAAPELSSPDSAMPDRIAPIFAQQMKLLIRNMEKEFGHDAANDLRAQLPATEEKARELLGPPHTPATMIHATEFLGNLVHSPNGILTEMMHNALPSRDLAGRLSNLLNLDDFGEKVLAWSEHSGAPARESDRAEHYWKTPGKERVYTADIPLDDIYPERKAERSTERSLQSMVPDTLIAALQETGICETPDSLSSQLQMQQQQNEVRTKPAGISIGGR